MREPMRILFCLWVKRGREGRLVLDSHPFHVIAVRAPRFSECIKTPHENLNYPFCLISFGRDHFLARGPYGLRLEGCTELLVGPATIAWCCFV